MNPPRVLAALAVLLAPATVFAQSSPSPYTSAARYDAIGRVTGTIAPDPDGSGPLHFAAVRNTYDGAGRLTKVETGELAGWQSEQVAPASWASFNIFRTLETTYDSRSRKTRDTVREGATGPIRAVTDYSYDNLGRLTCTAVRMNEPQFGVNGGACYQAGGADYDRITRNVYDAAGQRIQLREGVNSPDEGTEATWKYSPNGKVTRVIDGNGNRADLVYDGLDRQICWIFPSTTRATNFNDATQEDALNSAGQASGDCNAGPTGGDYERYEYDLNGNRTSLRRRDGATGGPQYDGIIHYQYDALNRVTAKLVPERAAGPQILTAAQTRDVYYSYDLRNLQLSARFDSQTGEGVTSTYDGFGRQSSSSTNMGGTTRTLSYLHDRNGNRTHITHPDTPTTVGFSTGYDGLNRPYYLSADGETGGVYAYYTPDGQTSSINRYNVATVLSYDGVQRPASLTHYFGGANTVQWVYGRNSAGQLSSVARNHDGYAWAGHYPVNRAYTTDGLNRYSQAGGATFGYDANGNLTSDGDNSYVYDVENRLVSSSGAHSASLAYDPLGRLWQVTSGSNVTRFLYDGDALVAEYDGAGAMTRRHAHWPGADIPMMSYDGASIAAPRALYADHQGSIVALASTTGTVTSINRYDEYGIPNIIYDVQGHRIFTNAGRFQYTGQAWLPELDMYYYKARIYSPFLGRFMQTDPIGYDGGINLYGYVGDDPVNRADPTGNQGALALPVLGACAGPQAVGCGLIGIGAACVLSSACRDMAETAANSRLGSAVLCVSGNCGRMVQRFFNAANEGNGESAASTGPRDRRNEGRTPAPALEGDPYHPTEVDRRRSRTREQEGAPSNDPDSPVPDRSPGSDQGGHAARGRTPHSTGERNVNPGEEHSRRPKRNPSGQQQY